MPKAQLPKEMDALKNWKSKYPLLYHTDKSGKSRVWACWLDGSSVWRTDGQVGGKLKDPISREFKGNTLRNANEQAEQEIQKMWVKQLDKGYAPAEDDKVGRKIYAHVQEQKSQNGGMLRGVQMFGKTKITTNTTAGKKNLSDRHHPMLAKQYLEQQAKVTFPAYVQAKVDGLRALPQLGSDGTVSLESRNGKNYVHLEHIRKEIAWWLKEKNCTDLVLDGEMYIHCLYRTDEGEYTYDHTGKELKGVERFQFLSEACKITRSKPHEQEALVEFWVFDIWDPTQSFESRWKRLQELFRDYPGDIIKLVPTHRVNSHEEIESWMSEFVGEKSNRVCYEFEGLMVRQAAAKYVARENYHCDQLLKYKRFEDEEWTVFGAEECAGTQKGAIRWKLYKDVSGKRREVVAKQMGSVEESRKLYQEYCKRPKKYNGKLLNIRFNERSKDGVPRFPRATVFPQDKF